ncbi:hypothetical protein L6452_37442 [Arctium lappa]|uniref:Uncharacterized protein n=1 Tax=Arctium lappa TaxID=4217 RepID=A0ACB8Y328_ARCLA|nr:hypothetical protein L6452_37442 [Arctium lappa]
MESVYQASKPRLSSTIWWVMVPYYVPFDGEVVIMLVIGRMIKYLFPHLQKGYPSDSASYNDPNFISQRLPIILHKIEKLKVPNSLFLIEVI